MTVNVNSDIYRVKEGGTVKRMAESVELERRLEELSRRTGYKVWTRHGQRIFGGPPPGWTGDSEPERGTEVYCYKLPRLVLSPTTDNV